MSEDEQEEEVVEGEGLRPYFVSRVSFAYQKIYKGLTICQTDGTKYVLGRPLDGGAYEEGFCMLNKLR